VVCVHIESAEKCESVSWSQEEGEAMVVCASNSRQGRVRQHTLSSTT
jgi:hypothetical protein